MPKTGETNRVSGIYKSTHCGKNVERAFAEGKTFAPCDHCHQAVEWVLVRKTQTK
jgi:hypothetical protein